MAKIVQPLLVVAAVAVNVVPGVGQVLSAAMITSITAAGIGAGLGIASSVLGLGPKAPKVSAATRERLYASIDPATPRKLVFGETALATDIRYEEWNGAEQEYLDRIICVASHRITDVQEIWLDDKLAWSAAGGAQGEFAGYLTVDVRTEGNAGNFVTIAGGAKWGANRRMTGLAYLRMRFKVTGNGKKKESPFAQNITNRMTVIGRAMPVYDPRFDDTRGGSGTMRADDQATWAYDVGGHEIGRNPACQLLTYLLGWRINGKLAVGRGIPPARIDFDSFITAANACDEPVVRKIGGTEPRYRADGIFSESDDPRSVIDTYETTMNAKLRDAGGRFALTVISNDLGAPRFDFDDNDVLGEFRWTPTPDIDRTFNEIRGRYTNPVRSALFQLVDYPRYRQAPLDGIERPHTFDLPMVQSPSQAQRLAKQQFARNQYQGQFECQLGVRGWAVQLGDVVTLTFSAMGWDRRVFRVIEHGIRPDGVCPVILQEENPAIYLWDADERPEVQPVQPVPYDPAKAVLFQLLVAGQIDYADGKSLQHLQPATPDATAGAPAGTNVGGIYDPITETIVGGKPAQQVVRDIDDLFETYGDTIAAGAARIAAEAARDVSQLAAANAQTARDQAQAARSGAEGARTDAVNAALAAGVSESAAAGSATVAASRAGEASVSAGQAATSATNAAGSASSAATSSVVAATAASESGAAALTGNRSPGAAPTLWSVNQYNTFAPDPTQTLAAYVATQPSAFQIVNGRVRIGYDIHLHPTLPIAVDPTRRLYVAARVRLLTDGPQNGGHTLFLTMWDKDGNLLVGNTVYLNGLPGGAVSVATGDFIIDARLRPSDYDPRVAFVRPMYRTTGGSVTEVSLIYQEDEETGRQSADSASAASSSAASAAASQVGAEQSASAASGSANIATTRAGEARTYRDEAAVSASGAAGSASAASSQAGLAAGSASAAGGSATAAAGSASLASTKADEAGNSATAAYNARVAAESARDGAASSAGVASGSAASASGSAAAALDYRNTTATYRDQAAGSAGAAAGSAYNAGLSASASESSAARADATTGALAIRVDQVEVIAGNAAASAGTTAEAVATIQGQVATRWTAQAVSPGGRAQVSVYSSSNGGAGVDIVGDVAFRGETGSGLTIINPAGVRVYYPGGQIAVFLGI